MKLHILKPPYNNPNPTTYTDGSGDQTVDTRIICPCGTNVFTIYKGDYLIVAKCKGCDQEFLIGE